VNNSDILFIQDAKMCNPNGDPDDENKPRMDYEAEKNLVSDVRLKRYIRDWLNSKGHEIFVAKVNGETVDATKRLQKLFEDYREKGEKVDVKITNLEKKHKDWLLRKLIDVRLFGATMPIKSKEGAGVPNTYTGPVQFNWGYSLNKAEIVTASSISSTFAGRTKEGEGAEGQEYGTFGKDWRVYYSLIAFHGIVSEKRATVTMLSDTDVKLLDNALIKAIPQEATTRSKIGQTPRLYLRVEYNSNETFLGDLRRAVDIDRKEGLRDISEVKLNLGELVKLLKAHKDEIKNIYLWEHEDLRLKDGESLKDLLKDNFQDKIIDLPHQVKETAEAKL